MSQLISLLRHGKVSALRFFPTTNSPKWQFLIGSSFGYFAKKTNSWFVCGQQLMHVYKAKARPFMTWVILISFNAVCFTNDIQTLFYHWIYIQTNSFRDYRLHRLADHPSFWHVLFIILANLIFCSHFAISTGDAALLIKYNA